MLSVPSFKFLLNLPLCCSYEKAGGEIYLSPLYYNVFLGISVKLTATVLNFGSQDDAVTVPAAVAETPLKSHSGEVSVR